MVAPSSELDASGHGNTSAQRRWMHVTQPVLAGKDIMKTFQKVQCVCVCVSVDLSEVRGKSGGKRW